jgi:subtilisin-like proprotein convertase family protein
MLTSALPPLLAFAVTLTLAAPTHPADAKKRFQTITRTFASADVIAAPTFGAASPYPSTIEVSGFRKAKIVDIDIAFSDFYHLRVPDVDILLVAPNGRRALVWSDIAGGALSTSDITLDDEASAPLPASGSLTSGRFRPRDVASDSDAFPAPAPQASGSVRLKTFDGGRPNGTWRLFVNDDAPDESGKIEGGWSLRIRAKVRR